MKLFKSEGRSNEKRPSSETTAEKGETQQKIIKAILLAILLAGALAVVNFSFLGDYLDVRNLDALQANLVEFQNWAPAVFLLIGALVITLGAPRSIIAILGGVVFGFFWGVILALAAALLGSIVIFLLTKWLGRPLFKQKVEKYLKAVEEHVETHGILIVILLRQLPLTCMLVNVLIGLTSISFSAFLLGSVVGLLPEAVIFALYGSSLQQDFVLRVTIASILLVLLVWVIKNYYSRSPLAKKLAQKVAKVYDGRH